MIAIVVMLIGWVYESHLAIKKNASYENELKEQSLLIDSLSESLQASNEKRGRLFLTLLYTDIPGKKKDLDSLLIEIGKDN